MKVEILFPEICNMYGDGFHKNFLKSYADTVYETHLEDAPHFVKEDVDFIYLGSCSDYYLPLILEKLKAYKENIIDYISKDKIFLVTGNTLEVFGEYVIEEDKKIAGLGIFSFYTKKTKEERYNYLFLGKFKNIEIVGYKSQFSLLYKTDKYPFIKKVKGLANNFEDNNEGILEHNFYGTYLIGPLLLLNPLFAKYLFALCKKNKKIPYEEEAMQAYLARLQEFKDSKTKMKSNH